MTERRHRHDFRDLRYLIERSLGECPEFGGHVEVEGRINCLPEGVWHQNYWFWIRAQGAPAERAEQGYVLRLLERQYDWQKGPEPRQRLLREAETLERLKETELAHPTPELICLVQDDDSETLGMIETGLPGMSLDHFRDRTTLKAIGRVAATIHRLSVQPFSYLPCSPDRAHHAKVNMGELDTALFDSFPLAAEVREWIEGHLPPGDCCCLLHGDLRPQNLLCNLMDSTRENAEIGIIDWEMARIGDPAYDLAIVSRGNRKVLHANDGARVLVEEYLKCGGQPISLTDVRVHELLLVLHGLEEAWRECQKPERSGHGPDFYLKQLRSLLRRVA